MVLITGITSPSALSLVRLLLKSGNRIRCCGNSRPEGLPSGAEYLQADLLNPEDINKLCSGVKAVVHFQDMKSHGRNTRRKMRKMNIDVPVMLYRAADKSGASAFFQISSYSVYGKPGAIPVREHEKKKPKSSYGKDKLKAEAALIKASAGLSTALTIFRPALTISPGTENPVVLLTLYLATAISDESRVYVGRDGNSCFQLLHPDDFARAIFLAFNNSKTAGKIYNVGSDRVPRQIEQYVRVKDELKIFPEIRHISRVKAEFLSLLHRPFKFHFFSTEHIAYLFYSMILDCQEAKKDLGWEPAKSNFDIILETARWYITKKLY